MNVAVRDLKARLSHYLEIAARGETVVVTNRGRPLAHLVPVPGADNVDRGRAEGWITRSSDDPPRPGRPQQPMSAAHTIVDILTADRDG